MTLSGVLLLGCAAAEIWYATGFGELDHQITIGTIKLHLNFTVVSWAVAAVIKSSFFNILCFCLLPVEYPENRSCRCLKFLVSFYYLT